MEFKKELITTLYESTLQNDIFYSAEDYIEDLAQYYDIEETNNGWIINDCGEETYLSRKEIEETIKESAYDRLKGEQ